MNSKRFPFQMDEELLKSYQTYLRIDPIKEHERKFVEELLERNIKNKTFCKTRY